MVDPLATLRGVYYKRGDQMYSDLIALKKYMPEQVILQLSDDNNVGSICEEIVDDAIGQGQRFIDGYLRGRYPAGMADADVPDLIKDICTTLACYNLYRRKLQTTLPEALSKEYSTAIQTLKDIQSGKITPFPTASEPVVIVHRTKSKVYTDDVLGTIPG
jgi:phage gp36-like protein